MERLPVLDVSAATSQVVRKIMRILAYAASTALLLVAICVASAFTLLQGAQHVQFEVPPTPRKELAQSAPSVRSASTQPVWILPTPKYQYDPALMVVKPKAEREAELKRKQQQQQQQQQVVIQRAKQEQRARQKRDETQQSYTYAPEQLRDFMMFPMFRN